MDFETKHYADGSSACGPGPLPDHSPEQQERAKLVAWILTENGHPVSSPDEGDLDDVERERWNVCVEIVRRLDAWTLPRRRLLWSDSVPDDFLSLHADNYPLCPECGGETGLTSSKEGRSWNCDVGGCGWKGALT